MAFLGATTTTFSPLLRLLFILLILPLSTLAQFQFFEQMFNNPSQAQQHAQHSPQQQNVASDSSWYRRNYDGGEPLSPPRPLPPPPYFFLFALFISYYSGWLTGKNILLKIAFCSNYLCPGTLACVHFPHHCPCAWPAQEDKFELGEGSAVCVSKKGWKESEVGRRVELARKGWI